MRQLPFWCIPLLFALNFTMASAQSDSSVVEHSFEIGLLGGRPFGSVGAANIHVTTFDGRRVSGPGTATMVVNAGGVINKRLVFFGQASFLSGGRQNQALGGGFSSETNTQTFIYESGVQIRFGVRPFSKIEQQSIGKHKPQHNYAWEPYLIAAAAAVQNRADILVNFKEPDPNPAPNVTLGGATRVRLHQAAFAPAMGVGTRLYLTAASGLRVEAKSYFPTGEVKTPLGSVSVGFFLRFR